MGRTGIKDYIDIFLTFSKIGICTFGGGYAMIPLLKREITDNKKWLNDDELINVIAISETTPGPVAINAATFTGYRRGGIPGAILATLGVVIPSFVIIVVLARLLAIIYGYSYVKAAFRGIRICVFVLIAGAAVTMGRKCDKNIFSLIIAIAAFWLSFFLNINAAFIIVGAAALGTVYSCVTARRKK